MRVLISTVPELGHLYPIQPLARALADAGHEVTFAVSPELGARVAQAGLAAVPTGVELSVWFEQLAEKVGGEPGAGLPPEAILQWFMPRAFAEVGAALTLPDLLRVASTWRPDLIVHDSYELAAPIAARSIGVPNVQHTLGPMVPIDVMELTSDAVAPLWKEQGLAPPVLCGAFDWLCLAISPPSLEIDLDPSLAARCTAVRPVGYDAARFVEAPAWLDRLPDRPLVYGTLGTHLNRDRAVFRAMLDGLAEEDLDIVVTVGSQNDPAWLGPVPDNARVERFIPQSLLFDRCAAVVSHGGSGTILPALGRGIPHVVIPQGADNFVNADRCLTAGVGVRLMPSEVSAGAVRAAVREVLDNPAFRTRAGAVREEIAAMPEPAAMVPRLEELAAGASR